MKTKRPADGEIIIKRRKKGGHGEAHGGAWKVAFADFTLAMMALFMVLWIIQPQRINETAAADAELNPLVDGGAGLFDGVSNTPIELDGLPAGEVAERNQKEREVLAEQIEKNLKEGKPISLEELAVLMDTLAIALNAEANLLIDIVPQGLRILIKDDDNRFMFERGSSNLNPVFKVIIERLAKTLNNVDNNLIVSGHTDATKYRNDNSYNNWNLSGDRALVARNALVQAGLKPEKVLQVTAQADTTLINPERPEDGSNRRIELLILTKHAEALYRQIFGKAPATFN